MVSVIVICAVSAAFLFLSVQASSIRSATTTTTGNAATADINNNNTDTSGISILDAPRIVGGDIVQDPNDYPYYGAYIIYNAVFICIHRICFG